MNQKQSSTYNKDLRDRKLKHVEVCLNYPVEYKNCTTGFEQIDLPYNALPESNLKGVDINSDFLGKKLNAPLLIGAMTGGADLSKTINRNLALAAEHLGIGFMLGSQRVMLANVNLLDSFRVRPYAPTALIFGNLGIAQLNQGYDAQNIRHAIKLIEADALALHTNPLQEAMQKSGDNDFTNLLARLPEVIKAVEYPIILKEVGHGLSAKVALNVKEAGFAALDIAGAGGTSWAKVEDYVRYGEIRHADLVEWGIPTVRALLEVRRALPDMPLIASGGIRTGLDAAKALALGARVVAVARPLLKPAIESADAVVRWLENFIWELKVAMHCSGARSLNELKSMKLSRHQQ